MYLKLIPMVIYFTLTNYCIYFVIILAQCEEIKSLIYQEIFCKAVFSYEICLYFTGNCFYFYLNTNRSISDGQLERIEEGFLINQLSLLALYVPYRSY